MPYPQWPPLFFIFFALILFAMPTLAEVKIDIAGVDEDIKNNIKIYLGQPTNDSPRNVSAFIEKLSSETAKSLQALGYYKPKINIIDDTEIIDEKTVAKVKISINKGAPTRVRDFNIQLLGEAADDTQFNKLLNKLPLKLGSILNHGDYEASKSLLFDVAQERGYFDAKFVVSTAVVHKNVNGADVTLIFDSGVRYQFGKISFLSDIFDSSFLERWLPFDTGTPYDAKLVAELTKQLQGSGYFQRVRVHTLRDEPVGNKIPVNISLTGTSKNNVGIGIGYATDTGPRTKLTWRRPRHNRRGHSLEFSTGLAEKRQDFTAQYKIPKTKKPLTDYFLIDFGAQNEDSKDTRSQLRTLNFQHVRRTPKLWQESVFVRWENEKYEVSGESDRVNLILPGVSWSRTRTQGKASKLSGDQLSLQVMAAHTDVFSDVSLLKSVLNMKWLYPLNDRHRFIMSLSYGAIATSEFSKVPASHRFYIGGDRSIRGFDYRSISPEDDNGDLTGGRFKEVGSVEYNYRFYEKWSLAAFLDAGRSFDHFDERYRVGAGLGLRWLSPVGPFRIDLGFGVSEDDIPWLVHISLGPDL